MHTDRQAYIYGFSVMIGFLRFKLQPNLHKFGFIALYRTATALCGSSPSTLIFKGIYFKFVRSWLYNVPTIDVYTSIFFDKGFLRF